MRNASAAVRAWINARNESQQPWCQLLSVRQDSVQLMQPGFELWLLPLLFLYIAAQQDSALQWIDAKWICVDLLYCTRTLIATIPLTLIGYIIKLHGHWERWCGKEGTAQQQVGQLFKNQRGQACTHACILFKMKPHGLALFLEMQILDKMNSKDVKKKDVFPSSYVTSPFN